MRTKANAMKAGLVLLGVFLIVGFYEVLEKRFSEGGIYPHYASYRSDPLGTSVFYEALEGIDSISVSKNVKDLNAIRGLDRDSVILLLGYPRDGFDDIRAPAESPVMKAVEEGARLVLTINPELVPEVYRPRLSELEEDWTDRRRRIREERASREAGEDGKEKAGEKTGKEEKKEPGKAGTEPDAKKDTEKGKASAAKENADGKKKAETAKQNDSVKDTSAKEKPAVKKKETEEEKKEREIEEQMNAVLGPPITEKLGFKVESPIAFTRPEEGWETEPGETATGGSVPSEMPVWRSQYRFQTKDPSWKAVMKVEGKPVVIERRFGKGSVVLASDTYFASNENLHLGAEPEFLLWLIGGKSKVVFDETIHGTVEEGGAMKLVRRYRAHGFFLGLVAFLILWAWRSASPLVPGNEASDLGFTDGSESVAGEETGAGLIRLLRRSVPAGGLLSRCVEIWSGSAVAEVPEKTRAAVGAIVERHRTDPRHFGAAEAYRAIVDLLRKR